MLGELFTNTRVTRFAVRVEMTSNTSRMHLFLFASFILASFFIRVF